ncbi:hypothetical protein [Streptomyces gelaticus]|nr:hypothetical protein [Streptomyces gelaticus]
MKPSVCLCVVIKNEAAVVERRPSRCPTRGRYDAGAPPVLP